MKTILLILLLLTLQVSVEAKSDTLAYKADTVLVVKKPVKKADPVKVKKAANLFVQIITSILAFLYLLRQ